MSMMTKPLPADRLIANARIYTMDGEGTVAESMVVRCGRVLATGSAAEMRAVAAKNALVEDLAGKTVIPGLVDAHIHMAWTGQMLNEVLLFDCRSIDDIVRKIAERAKQVSPGTWIRGRGWDETLLSEGRHPSRRDLDPVSPDNPVVIERVFNRLVANSAALAFCGIDRDTPDIPQSESYSGYFERDADGEPTGLFREAAKGLILNKIPPPTKTELAEAIVTAVKSFNELGLTAVEEPNLSDEELDAYDLVIRRGQLTVRTEFMLPGWGFLTALGLPHRDGEVVTERLKQIPFKTGLGDGMFRLGGLKIMPDGGIGDFTARMIEPYDGDPSTKGTWIIDPDRVAELVMTAHQHDLALDAHVCGDAALEVTVEAIGAAQEADPRPWLRHRVHHAYFPTAKTLEVMARHRIPAVVSSPFLIHRADSYFDTVGTNMTNAIMPTRTYLDAGVPLASGADTPTADWNPWEGIFALCTRTTLKGRQLDQGEVLTVGEALRVYTSGGAFALGRDGELGSLEAGKRADFVVLPVDPHEVSLEEVRTMKPLATMVGGEYVYDGRLC